MYLRSRNSLYRFLLAVLLLSGGPAAYAQNAAVGHATIDAGQITVGDAARVFIEVQHDPATSSIQWAVIPDSTAHLEVIEKGKIDTLKSGSMVTYKQRLLVTGFDSGAYYVPSFQFSVLPKSGTPYVIATDSLPLLVQTVAVDTTKAFKPIKGILEVKSTWRDYIWLIAGIVIFLILMVFVIVYFIRNKGTAVPVKTVVPGETLQEKAMRLLLALENDQLWQKGQVKEYYIRLTGIVRGYVEARFDTAALELTTDELLDKARLIPGVMQIVPQLEMILRTADLAKFAKAQPTPAEHTTAMQLAKEIITVTRPVIIENPSTPTNA